VSPVLCLITDRRRYGDDWQRAVVERVHAAARAGVHLVQVRERDLDGGPLASLIAACVDAVRDTRTRVLVNDRLDVALTSGAHGVHLRADSMPAARARCIAPPGFLIGRSAHSVEEAVRVSAAGSLDYVMFGTVFATDSKPGRAPAGLATLAAVSAAIPLPVLAVGGITPARTAEAVTAGAAGVAAIGMFADLPRADLERIIKTLVAGQPKTLRSATKVC
jgi:thiamine-phosphate pyrophosphorylase